MLSTKVNTGTAVFEEYLYIGPPCNSCDLKDMQQNVDVDDIFNWWKNHNLSTMQYSNPLQETYNILKEFDLEAEDVTNEQEKKFCVIRKLHPGEDCWRMRLIHSGLRDI